MKKVLLSLLSVISLGAFAQTITVDDTVSTGVSQIYYTADSSAADLDAITGAAVTWDYSGLQGYSNGGPLIDTIKAAANTSFASATYHDDMSGGASNYFKNFADSIVSYGYTFEVDGNLVNIMHNSDPLKTAEFPMSLGSTFNDSIYGECEIYSQLFDTYGGATVTADGTGTLLLGDSTYTNVIRVKLLEELVVDSTFIGFPLNDWVTGTVTRTMYSYFDFSTSNMPLFLHGTIAVATNVVTGEYKAVYSVVDLSWLDASFGEETIEAINIYPNPAEKEINITSTDVDELMVVNTLGQTVTLITKPNATETVDVSNLESGIYFVKVKKGNAVRTEKFTVK
jgi:hypothetical protein